MDEKLQQLPEDGSIYPFIENLSKKNEAIASTKEDDSKQHSIEDNNEEVFISGDESSSTEDDESSTCDSEQGFGPDAGPEIHSDEENEILD